MKHMYDNVLVMYFQLKTWWWLAVTHYLPTHTMCSLTSMIAQSVLFLASYVKNS